MPDLDMQEVGRRLQQARQQRGLAQHELALASGVGQNQISNLERGKKPSVRADTIVALAQALQVTTDFLLGLETAHKPKRTRTAGAA